MDFQDNLLRWKVSQRRPLFNGHKFVEEWDKFQGVSEAYRSFNVQESISRSRLSGWRNDSKPEESFLQNCDLCKISSGVDSQNWTSRLVAWVQKDHRTWVKRFFFRSRLAGQEEPTRSLRRKLVQNYVKIEFTQESTPGEGRVDSWWRTSRL